MNWGFDETDFPTLVPMVRGLFSLQGWKRTGRRSARAARWMGRVARKAAKPVGAVLVLLLAVHAVLMVVWGRQLEDRLEQIREKGEPATVADLVRKPIPDGENGALIYEKAFKLIDLKQTDDPKQSDDLVPARYSPIARYLSSTHEEAAWNQLGPAVRRIVRETAPIYPLIRRASSYPKCSFPVNWSRGPSAFFLHPSELLQIERLQVAKAVVEAKDGHGDSATDDMLIALRVSNAGSTEPSMLFPLLRSANVGFSYVGLNTVANIHTLTRQQARELYDEAGRISLQAGFMTALTGERTMTTWVFDDLRRDLAKLALLSTGADEESVPPSHCLGKVRSAVTTYLWRPISYKDEMLSLDYWDKQLDLASLPYRKIYKQKSMDPYLVAPVYATVTRRYFPVFDGARTGRDRAEAQLAVARVAMAAQAYRSQFHSYPKSLAELSARLGWNLPDDPLSGKPLIYKRTDKGFKVYSVGTDMKDDGGIPEEVLTKPRIRMQGDIVWEQTR